MRTCSALAEQPVHSVRPSLAWQIITPLLIGLAPPLKNVLLMATPSICMCISEF